MTRTVTNVMLALGSSFPALLIVRVTMATAVTLAITRMARRSRASLRHTILAAGFAMLLVLPITSMVAPRFEIKLPVPQHTARLMAMESQDRVLSMINTAIVARSGETGRPVWDPSIPSVAAGIWALGAISFMLPVFVGIWQLAKIRRTGLPWFRGDTILQGLKREAQITKIVQVLVHESVSGPVTCGVFRPAIAFPAGADSWNHDDLRRAMIHELEHVRRYDCLTHLLSRIGCALYWFHPFVWMSWRRLGLEAERACDDVVLSHGNAADYADQLVTLARAITAGSKTTVLAMANRSDLRMRVSAVLDSRQRRGRPGTRAIAVTVLWAALFTVMISPLRVVSATAGAAAQSSEGRQEYEVASIKPKGPFKGPAMIGVEFLPGGLMRATNAPVSLLITAAYRISPKQLDFKNVASEKGFSDLMNEVFDAEAKAGINEPPESVPPAERRHRHALMLQTLLEDRFKLVLHKESRETDMYALVVAPNGPKLKPSPADRPCPPGTTCGHLAGGPANGVRGLDVPISALVSTLIDFGERQVIDRTGLAGRFDIQLPPWSRPWLPPRQSNPQERSEDPNDPTILTVLQDSLGLRLESIRGPMDIYVVDHIELPTAN